MKRTNILTLAKFSHKLNQDLETVRNHVYSSDVTDDVILARLAALDGVVTSLNHVIRYLYDNNQEMPTEEELLS